MKSQKNHVKIIIENLSETFAILKSEKKILFLSLIPVSISIILFSVIGVKLFNFGLEQGKEYLSGFTENYFIYFFIIIFVILSYMILNFLFFLIVSLVSSPFNDLISESVAFLKSDQVSNSSSVIKNDFKEIVKQKLSSFKNNIIGEVKKIIFILFILACSFLLSIIPFLSPVTFIISLCLICYEFLDYSWSRESYTLNKILKMYKGNIIVLLLSGLMFSLLLSIPLINIFVLPIGVIYFTLIFLELEK